RWFDHSVKTTPPPASGRQDRPPYSITRLRAFHPGGIASRTVPSGPRRTTHRRPPSCGRGSSHHTSSPKISTHSGRSSTRATSTGRIGESFSIVHQLPSEGGRGTSGGCRT